MLSSKIDANKKTISLTFAGSSLSDSQKEHIKVLSQNFKLQKSSIIFNQGLTFDDQCFYAETKLFSNQENSIGVNTPVLFIKTINGKLNETEK